MQFAYPERHMSQNNSQQVQGKSWKRPELTKLGKLADVGPRVPGLSEGSNNQS